MTTTYFTTEEGARRYDLYRPKVQDIVLTWLAGAPVPKRFSSALDVACGTGDSTLPLLRISGDVLGIDRSPAMLGHARKKGLKVEEKGFEDLSEVGAFDLITTCMAFHWFDPEKAVQVYKRVSRPGAVWVIYNFAFAGHLHNASLNAWFQDVHLREYPTPARNKASNTIPAGDPSLRILREEKGFLPVEFSAETLVGYLTTQSNVEEVVKSGKSFAEVEADLFAGLKKFDLAGPFKYSFTYGIYSFEGK